MEDDCYVLVTCHQTILDLTEDGELFHHPAAVTRVAPRLMLDSRGEILRSRPYSAAAGGWQIEKIDMPRCLAVRKDGLYVTAEVGGGLRLSPRRMEWETFDLVSFRTFLRDQVGNLPALPRKPRACSISRIIHQTSRSAEVPEECVTNVARMCALNPNWHYRYWSQKESHDFIYGYYGWEILESYLQISACYGAARADLFRYLVVYQFGGVYLDMKSGVDRPFESILQPDDEFVLSHWRNQMGDRYRGFGLHSDLEGIVPGGEYQQWHIMAAAGHPFLEAVIVRVLRNIAEYNGGLDGVGRLGVLRVTGPVAYSLAIHPIRARHGHRLIDAEASGLLFEAAPRPGGRPHYRTLTTPVVS